MMTREEREARTRADLRASFAREKARHAAASKLGAAARDRSLRAKYGNDYKSQA